MSKGTVGRRGRLRKYLGWWGRYKDRGRYKDKGRGREKLVLALFMVTVVREVGGGVLGAGGVTVGEGMSGVVVAGSSAALTGVEVA